jgi:hypothetical protein
MAVDSKICVLYLFCNGDNMTNAFTGVLSSSGEPIRSLVFQSCNPDGPANHMSSSIGSLYRVMTKKMRRMKQRQMTDD